jgi:uncharacterized membrane protein
VIVMIEVHCLNVWLRHGLLPGWLNYVNGLVAPAFILCSGYSLVLSAFRPDGSLRPFAPTARRLGFILLCGYLLHAPGLRLVDWTLLATPQRLREVATFDVLHCIVVSLLVLHGLARLTRRPAWFALAALLLGLAATLLAPLAWAEGVADGWWPPVRGMVNGNPDRGVQALFPLFPWFSFAAFGAVLGVAYRELRVVAHEGRARWSEARWLLALAVAGLVLLALAHHARGWPWHGGLAPEVARRLHNTTLTSVLQRAGVVFVVGAGLGLAAQRQATGSARGGGIVDAASRESLLVYVLHLIVVFRLGLGELVRTYGQRDGQGWAASLAATAVVMALSLGAAAVWQKERRNPPRAWRLQKTGLAVLGAYFILGGWTTVAHLVRHPEEAREPHLMIDWARARKSLPPFPAPRPP